MIRCYLLAVCQASSIDRDSNCLTLFQMIEQMQFMGPWPPVLSIEVHTYWKGVAEDVGQEMECRVIRVAEDGREESGPTNPFAMSAVRVRNRHFAFTMPTRPGSHELRVEWRARGSEDWVRESAFWPFVVESLSETPASQQEEPAALE